VSRVLLTGATGFVGRPLLERLIADGDEVHALSSRRSPGTDNMGVHWHRVDLLDPTAAPRVAGEVEPEQLVHLAWYVSHGRFWSAPENVDWVEASLRLLRAFTSSGGRRAVFVGTCAEYAWGGEEDLDERDSALAPGSLYGVCKDALRRIATAYAGETGLELAWARLFFLYGPGEQSERLVPAVIRSLISGERVATSAGEQVRDFVHVYDAAAALVAVLRSELTGPVNIASGVGTSVAEVLDTIGALTGATDLIDRGRRPASASEPPRIVASVRRLTEEARFQPSFSLRDGLATTIDWWRDLDSLPSSRS
jgi:nucleoside-diphosphate-sugar epimerase